MFIYFQLKVLSERYEKTSENPSTRTRIRICLFYVFQSGDIRFPTQKHTFPVRKTYSFALRNIEYGQTVSSHSLTFSLLQNVQVVSGQILPFLFTTPFFSYISVVSFFSVILRSILQHNFMKYKLLVLDLDGTLTNKQKKITLTPKKHCSRFRSKE